MFWILLLIALGGVLIWVACYYENQREEEREEKRQLAEAQKRAEIGKKTLLYNTEKEKLIEKYGEPDKTIVLEDLDLSKEIIAFGKSNIIWLLGKVLPMDDVVSCTLNDDSRVLKGKVSYETKSSIGNIATRAVVGGLLLGGVGAVVGGATAKKNTVVNQGHDIIIRKYTVVININSLSDPIISIPLGKDGAKANEIVGLMNVVISRRK